MSQPWKTVILWGALTGTFAAVFRFSSGRDLQLPSPFFVALFLFSFLFSFVVIFLSLFGRVRKRQALTQEGINLMQQGRFSEAMRKFEESKQAELTDYNVAVTRLALWQPAAAEARFDKAINARIKRMANLDLLAIPQRALARALQGKLELARRDLAEAERLNCSSAGTSLVAGGVIAAREGQWRKVLDLVNRHEVKQLGGPTRGLADVLVAWATRELTGERRTVDLIALYGETGPENVRQFWPELVAFVNPSS